jgi:hypothetical protein
VVLSGRVLRYATGWRGECARPKGLILVCPVCWIVGRDLHAPTVVEEAADYPAGLQPRCDLHRSSCGIAKAVDVQRGLIDAYGADAIQFSDYVASVEA